MFISSKRMFALLMAAASYSCGAGQLPADAPIANIDGHVIPYSDLQPSVQEQLKALQDQFDTQMLQLSLSTERARAEIISTQAGNLLNNRLLAKEARTRQTSMAALVDAIKIPAVTDAQIHAFYDSHASQIGKPFEGVEAQIKQFLRRQADEEAKRRYFDSLRSKYKASLTVEPMREQIEASGPQRGRAGAAVTIVEFSDFQCPYCGRLEPILAEIQKAYPTQVRLIYRHMPLTNMHPDAANAAAAAVCADKQGKFWEMHDLLFVEQSSLSIGALKEKGRRIGLDTTQFDHCLDAGEAEATLKADEAAYLKLGLSATPVSFVNGRFVNGAVSYDELSAIVEDELHRI
jgi:protein-disulfide isomerase